MDLLNNDIIAYILSKSCTQTIGRCLNVNKKWKQIIETYGWMFELNFSNLQINNESMKYFKNAKIINLKNCSKITNIGLRYSKQVRSIDLTRCDKITDDGLKYLKEVHTIDLTYCNKITNDGLKYLKEVHTINLDHCNKITDDGLKYLKGVSKKKISFLGSYY